MNSLKRSSELHKAVMSLRPYFVRATWFSLCSCLLVLAPRTAAGAGGRAPG